LETVAVPPSSELSFSDPRLLAPRMSPDAVTFSLDTQWQETPDGIELVVRRFPRASHMLAAIAAMLTLSCVSGWFVWSTIKTNSEVFAFLAIIPLGIAALVAKRTWTIGQVERALGPLVQIDQQRRVSLPRAGVNRLSSAGARVLLVSGVHVAITRQGHRQSHTLRRIHQTQIVLVDPRCGEIAEVIFHTCGARWKAEQIARRTAELLAVAVENTDGLVSRG